MGEKEVGRGIMVMEGHCWGEAQPEVQDSSTLYPGCGCCTSQSHFATPSLLAPHSSRVTLPAKWPWLWNLAGKAAQCMEDMSLAKLHFTHTPSAGSHRGRVWSETPVCTKRQHRARARGAVLTVP